MASQKLHVIFEVAQPVLKKLVMKKIYFFHHKLFTGLKRQAFL